MPYINLPVGSHYYTAVGDQSQIAGDATADLTCAVKEYFGFSVDVAFLVAYNSEAAKVANPIIKAEIAARPVDQPLGMPVYVTNLFADGDAIVDQVTNTKEAPVFTKAEE